MIFLMETLKVLLAVLSSFIFVSDIYSHLVNTYHPRREIKNSMFDKNLNSHNFYQDTPHHLKTKYDDC